ncbi:MAG: HepT-like ribonuclease domain-containing protein [Cetobacterium sp.]|uniref:HepT-like ribonuclease domain-containing protein n=1 Tax=Cetobacterium sp. TaxID=2071632 RepID=UPI002FC7D731
MYKKREVENYLIDIKEKIAKIKSKREGKTLEDFIEDEDLEIIVEHSLMIIGEATSKIPQEILIKYHDDSSYWRQIKDMRNLLIHQYWGVSIEMVYYVATKKIDELEKYIDKIIIGERVE